MPDYTSQAEYNLEQQRLAAIAAAKKAADDKIVKWSLYY